MAIQWREHLYPLDALIAINRPQAILDYCEPPDHATVAQLLAHPLGSRMGGDVEMDDLAPVVADNEEALQPPEGRSQHAEKVHRGEDFTMVTRKRQPLPAGVIRTGFAPGHVARD